MDTGKGNEDGVVNEKEDGAINTSETPHTITPDKLNASADSDEISSQNSSNHHVCIDIDDDEDDDDNNDNKMNDTPSKSQLVNIKKEITSTKSLSSIKRKLTEAEKLERLKMKELKEKQKQEEKERKEKEKNDLKMKRESERLEKEREKEDKKRQKEEEKKQKLEQIEEEKKKKEEARLEEKRKKDEDKRKEGAKEKQLMQNFFIKTSKKQNAVSAHQSSTSNQSLFMPFELKPDMKLAPCTRYNRINLKDRLQALENFIEHNNADTKLFLDQLKDKSYRKGSSDKTWPRDEEDDVVVISNAVACNGVISKGLKDENFELKPVKMKMKFLQFHDNNRPAYYGTWRKKSNLLTGRRPLLKDSKHLDYEVDSDEEWEEEEPGESIVNSEGEEENDGSEKGEDEGDDEFFVPHGYLSEGEGCDDEDDLSHENLKQMQMLKAKNFEASMKCKKIEKLRPNVHGLYWWNPDFIESSDKNLKVDQDYEDMVKFFKDFMAIPINCEFPIDVNEKLLPKIKSSPSTVPSSTQDKSTLKKRIYGVPDEALPFLIRLVHGCYWGMDKMTKEFKIFWCRRKKCDDGRQSQANDDMMVDSQQVNRANDDDLFNNSIISKRQLEAKIREMAIYKKDPRHINRLWYVNEDTLTKYDLLDLPIPNTWEWTIDLPPSSNKRNLSTNNTPSQTPEIEHSMNKEAKTPKMSIKSCTPRSFTNISTFLTRRQSQQMISAKKRISPSCNAVLSENTAKKQGSDSSRYPSESAFSPVDGAAQGSTNFENKKYNVIMDVGKQDDVDVNGVDVEIDRVVTSHSDSAPPSKKRSSEVEMGSDFKRSNKSTQPIIDDGDSSQDCMIVDSPLSCNSHVVVPLKVLNSELNNLKSTNKLVSESEAKGIVVKDEVFQLINDNSGRENQNQIVSRELNFNKATKVQTNLKTIKNFFNFEPVNK